MQSYITDQPTHQHTRNACLEAHNPKLQQVHIKRSCPRTLTYCPSCHFPHTSQLKTLEKIESSSSKHSTKNSTPKQNQASTFCGIIDQVRSVLQLANLLWSSKYSLAPASWLVCSISGRIALPFLRSQISPFQLPDINYQSLRDCYLSEKVESCDMHSLRLLSFPQLKRRSWN